MKAARIASIGVGIGNYHRHVGQRPKRSALSRYGVCRGSQQKFTRHFPHAVLEKMQHHKRGDGHADWRSQRDFIGAGFAQYDLPGKRC